MWLDGFAGVDVGEIMVWSGGAGRVVGGGVGGGFGGDVNGYDGGSKGSDDGGRDDGEKDGDEGMVVMRSKWNLLKKNSGII